MLLLGVWMGCCVRVPVSAGVESGTQAARCMKRSPSCMTWCQALRERGNVAVSRQALCAAGVGWGSLLKRCVLVLRCLILGGLTDPLWWPSLAGVGSGASGWVVYLVARVDLGVVCLVCRFREVAKTAACRW